MSSKSIEKYSSHLKQLLVDAIRESFETEEKIGALFSGGLDSSLTAAILSTLHSEPFPLFVTGIESAKDIALARDSAGYLNLPLTIWVFTEEDVKKRLTEILSILQTVDVLQVELAIPLFFATECANKFGITTLFSGQGADELFGGYARHERQFLQAGEEATIVEMEQDLQKLRQETLPLLQEIVHHFDVELITPFLNEALISFATDLPFSYKLSQSKRVVTRKFLLRSLARSLGFPPEIVSAPKRAIQYGSGAHRILADISAEYWSVTSPRLSQKEARSYVRIKHFLLQLIDK